MSAKANFLAKRHRIENLESLIKRRIAKSSGLVTVPSHGQLTLANGISPVVPVPAGLGLTSSIKLTKRAQVGDNGTVEYVALLSDRILGVPGSFIARALAAGGAGGLAAGVPLGVAATFGLLAGSGITNTGATVINGDVGSFPTPAQTGFGTVTVNGVNHFDDSVTQQAKIDLVAAFNIAAGKPSSGVIPNNLSDTARGGAPLLAGVWDVGAGDLPVGATLTLSGGPTDLFIIRCASSLVINTGAIIALIGGALAQNVLFLVNSSATIGTTATFNGTIIALTSISVATGATMNGGLLARNGAVTLQGNNVTSETGGTVASTDDSTLDWVATP